MDVGQADATLFEYGYDGEDYTILFDAGNWNQNNVVDYLHSQDIESLDVMMLSHPHADHIGQADTILDQFTVEEVWMSGDTHTSQTFERVMDAIDESDVAYEEPRAGEVYDVGPLAIETVNPDSSLQSKFHTCFRFFKEQFIVFLSFSVSVLYRLFIVGQSKS
ncbi:MBL fold metallo-hydrolase [Thalassobacillus sp. C254]|uniref:MBL fold metallo-hydrolase n=1 Tax=Thalassobacillus sp. C254 TaxID=1225341 RepID=UPI0006D21C54|nr:MBL fold metallo-hydrolase [Thalassobacillus sp. C254]